MIYTQQQQKDKKSLFVKLLSLQREDNYVIKEKFPNFIKGIIGIPNDLEIW